MENEQIVELIQAGTGNQKTLFTMLWENMRGLVITIARRSADPEAVEDYTQQGFLGLYEAAMHYKADIGVPFGNYAALWIRQSISRYRNENGIACRLPSHVAELKNKYKRFQAAYMLKHGTVPDDRTVCERLNIPADKLPLILAALQIETVCSTEAVVYEGSNEKTVSDMIPDTRNAIQAVEDRLQNDALAAVLWPLVDDLEEEQAEVIKARYRDDLKGPEIERERGWRAGKAYDLERRALWKLSHGRNRRELLPFIPEYVQAEAFRGSGAGRFNRTWTSSTERAALKLCGVDAEEQDGGTYYENTGF